LTVSYNTPAGVKTRFFVWSKKEKKTIGKIIHYLSILCCLLPHVGTAQEERTQEASHGPHASTCAWKCKHFQRIS
jgi:hypothetical protein